MNTWQTYVQIVAAGRSQTELASQTGIAQTSISRWLSGTKRPTEAAKVAAFATALDRNVLEAFVAAGMLTVEQAGAGLDDRSLKMLATLGFDEAQVDEDTNESAQVSTLALHRQLEKLVGGGLGDLDEPIAADDSPGKIEEQEADDQP